MLSATSYLSGQTGCTPLIPCCLALAWYYAGIYLSSHLALLTCTNILGPIMSLPEPMLRIFNSFTVSCSIAGDLVCHCTTNSKSLQAVQQTRLSIRRKNTWG